MWWMIGGWLFVSVLAALGLGKLVRKSQIPPPPDFRPPRMRLTDPPRVCDEHLLGCDCEACRIGY